MVALVNIEEVRKGLRIGIHANGKWYARIAAYDPSTKKDNTRDVSLKLKFEEGSLSNKNEAIEQARKIADKVGERLGKTSNPFKEYLVADLAKEWLTVIQFCTGENEKLAAKNKPMKMLALFFSVFLFSSTSFAASAADVVSLKCDKHIYRLNYEKENAEWVHPRGTTYMIPIEVGATQITVKASAAIYGVADGVIDRSTLIVSYPRAGSEWDRQCEIIEIPELKI